MINESPLITKAETQIRLAKEKKLASNELTQATIDLAAMMLEEAVLIQTQKEKKQQEQLARMMEDPVGKVFTTAITDQCFRSGKDGRIANQLVYLIQKYGVPNYLTTDKKCALTLFKYLGRPLSPITVPLTVKMLRKETASVILPGEDSELKKHMARRRKEGVRINLNLLGEAILGEEEALHRQNIYLADLAKPEVEYISIKISTIYSQINLLAWDETIEILSNRLRLMYRAAMKNIYVRPDGTKVPKFVNLDMEEYRDLHITVALFCKVLDEPEFLSCSAGIVLQAYLPDSYLIQQELTIWAMKRLAHGGVPIKIRIVKGANLAMEQVEAGLRLWPQAPYDAKSDVDANYKRMVLYACQKRHAEAAHIGIATHNLFDIAYALLLRAENNVEKEVCFEMLEGMADHMRRVVQQLSGDMLLYCPAATKEEFQNAVAYLVRRLDENTAPDNFLRHAFNLKPGAKQWNKQAELFSQSCLSASNVSYLPRRTQNRLKNDQESSHMDYFLNEPDTDWSLSQNRKWAKQILEVWKHKIIGPIPLVIGNKMILPQEEKAGIHEDPSRPGHVLYQYALATSEQIDDALNAAQTAQKTWSSTTVSERALLLKKVAQKLREHRSDLTGAMIADTGKTVQEADVEISEAIDFAEYYRFNIEELASIQDVQWKAKGVMLIAPPWNFPCSIPTGGVLAALVTGNSVIFKPAPESILVGWILAQIFWEAGVSKDVLQFVMCEDEPIGSQLIQDPRINTVVLTGATATAQLFLRLRPDLDLIAETGGKNMMVITGMSDRDLAIKDLIHSAFSHAGQKCSACSLAILEAEVYDDPHFHRQLRDASSSLIVGSAWDFQTRVNPLIRPPQGALLQAITHLEEGETWLLEPKQDPDNPNLWSPGIKLGVKPGQFTFENELFGPVLGLVRADNFDHALEIMNQTPYGLTAGIHSLDEREQQAWLDKIEAGNCYINRTITGAVVQRQPFGGCKESSFGKGAKAGGPNYLTQFMHASQIGLPLEQEECARELSDLAKSLSGKLSVEKDAELLKASLGSYAFYWKYYFSKKHDPSLVLGQDNYQCYIPYPKVVFRIQPDDAFVDSIRVIAAALTCRVKLEISSAVAFPSELLERLKRFPNLIFVKESESELIVRVGKGDIQRIRLLKEPSLQLRQALSSTGCHINLGPVLANGRLELLHYLREMSVSRDYHRYGNLGDRENEKRTPLIQSLNQNKVSCGNCNCHE